MFAADKLNRIRKHIEQYFTKYVCLLITIAAGIIVGAILTKFLPQDDVQTITNNINSAITANITNKSNYYWVNILNCFINNFRFVFLNFLFSFSCLLIPLIYVQMFFKGLSIGFTTFFLCTNLQIKGIIIAFASILYNLIFIVSIMLYFSVYCINTACFRKQIKENYRIGELRQINKSVILTSIIVLIILTAINLLIGHLLVLGISML